MDGLVTRSDLFTCLFTQKIFTEIFIALDSSLAENGIYLFYKERLCVQGSLKNNIAK